MVRLGKLVVHSMDRRFEGWSRRHGLRGCVLLLASVIAALTLGVAALLASSAPSFARARAYATGHGPASVAIGDLNGDGKPDLATANSGANAVSVLLNRGDGSFQAKRDYRTGREPESVAIGELAGDGNPDLATANINTSTVSVLVNRGDGSFQAKRDYRTGLYPHSVAIGDLNGDGKPDLVIGDAYTIFVLGNRGDGSFQAKRVYHSGSGLDGVAIGDLNGDGEPDLAFASVYASTVSVLANRGDASFRAKFDYRTGRFPQSIAIGDLNGDGKPDMATANGSPDQRAPTNSVSVLLNTPGLCTVQDIERQILSAAKRTIARANCRVGKIRRAYSTRVKKGRVISQKPSFGAVLPGGSKVNLVVSRGA